MNRIDAASSINCGLIFETYVPTCGITSTKCSSCSLPIASFIGVVETFSTLARSTTDRAWPGCSCNDKIPSLIALYEYILLFSLGNFFDNGNIVLHPLMLNNIKKTSISGGFLHPLLMVSRAEPD